MCELCRVRIDAGKGLPVETRSMRVLDLSLNASEDRVVGSLDLERAAQAVKRESELGILVEANRNVSYVGRS